VTNGIFAERLSGDPGSLHLGTAYTSVSGSMVSATRVLTDGRGHRRADMDSGQPELLLTIQTQ
jgi:hypothetical protein